MGLLICRPTAATSVAPCSGRVRPRRDSTDTSRPSAGVGEGWEARVVTGPAGLWSIQTNVKRKTATHMARNRKRSRQECGCGKDGREDEKTRSQTMRWDAMRWDDGMNEVEQWEMRPWGRFKGLGHWGVTRQKTERGEWPPRVESREAGRHSTAPAIHPKESGGQDRGGAAARCQLLSFCHRLTVCAVSEPPRASNHFP